MASRKMRLDSGHLSKLTTASAKLEIELPDTIEPTTTERFCADHASPPPTVKPKKKQRST